MLVVSGKPITTDSPHDFTQALPRICREVGSVGQRCSASTGLGVPEIIRECGSGFFGFLEFRFPGIAEPIPESVPEVGTG